MFAALHLPAWAVAAALRKQPGKRHLPCAVVAEGAEKLAAVNGVAQAAGVEAGWLLSRAWGRCPDLVVLERNLTEEARGLEALCQLAESLTADFELKAPDGLIMDLCRVGRGCQSAWQELELEDLELWRAAAQTPDLAYLGALNPGTQGRWLTPDDFKSQAIGCLRCLVPAEEAWLGLLDGWGLRTLGDFMNLPPQDLGERLGPQAMAWHELLHGRTCRLLRLHRTPEALGQSVDFEDPVNSHETLVFLLKRMLQALAARLAVRHLAVAHLKVSLRLDHGGCVEREIRLPGPLTEAADLLRPVRDFLESLRVDGAVLGVDLDALPCAPVSAQRDWYGRQLPRPDRWPETVGQLETLMGAGRVGIPLPSACHRADAISLRPVPMAPAAVGAGGSVAHETVRHSCSGLPLRRYRPGLPVAVASSDGALSPRPLAILTGTRRGAVVACHGPFPTSGGWWDSQAFWQRVEWDVQVADRELLRLAWLPSGHWQIEGVYG